MKSYFEQQVEKIYNELYPDAQLTERVISAKQSMDAYFAEKINLDAVAKKAFSSKFRFIRLFKSYYGRTPHQYLISLRMEKAKQFLKAGCSVPEACAACGFDSVTYFTGLFKRSAGCSPGLYRKKQLSRRLLADHSSSLNSNKKST